MICCGVEYVIPFTLILAVPFAVFYYAVLTLVGKNCRAYDGDRDATVYSVVESWQGVAYFTFLVLAYIARTCVAVRGPRDQEWCSNCKTVLGVGTLTSFVLLIDQGMSVYFTHNDTDADAWMQAIGALGHVSMVWMVYTIAKFSQAKVTEHTQKLKMEICSKEEKNKFLKDTEPAMRELFICCGSAILIFVSTAVIGLAVAEKGSGNDVINVLNAVAESGVGFFLYKHGWHINKLQHLQAWTRRFARVELFAGVGFFARAVISFILVIDPYTQAVSLYREQPEINGLYTFFCDAGVLMVALVELWTPPTASRHNESKCDGCIKKYGLNTVFVFALIVAIVDNLLYGAHKACTSSAGNIGFPVIAAKATAQVTYFLPPIVYYTILPNVVRCFSRAFYGDILPRSSNGGLLKWHISISTLLFLIVSLHAVSHWAACKQGRFPGVFDAAVMRRIHEMNNTKLETYEAHCLKEFDFNQENKETAWSIPWGLGIAIFILLIFQYFLHLCCVKKKCMTPMPCEERARERPCCHSCSRCVSCEFINDQNNARRVKWTVLCSWGEEGKCCPRICSYPLFLAIHNIVALIIIVALPFHGYMQLLGGYPQLFVTSIICFALWFLNWSLEYLPAPSWCFCCSVGARKASWGQMDDHWGELNSKRGCVMKLVLDDITERKNNLSVDMHDVKGSVVKLSFVNQSEGCCCNCATTNPFSCIRDPTGQHKLIFLIKVESNFTRDLFLKNLDPLVQGRQGPKTPLLKKRSKPKTEFTLRGPFESQIDMDALSDCNTFILVGTGTGIAAIFDAVFHLVRKQSTDRTCPRIEIQVYHRTPHQEGIGFGMKYIADCEKYYIDKTQNNDNGYCKIEYHPYNSQRGPPPPRHTLAQKFFQEGNKWLKKLWRRIRGRENRENVDELPPDAPPPAEIKPPISREEFWRDISRKGEELKARNDPHAPVPIIGMAFCGLGTAVPAFEGVKHRINPYKYQMEIQG